PGRSHRAARAGYRDTSAAIAVRPARSNRTMDAAFVALRLRHRSRHLRDAVSALLAAAASPPSGTLLAISAIALLPTLVDAAAHDPFVLAADSLRSLPGVGPIAIRPRVLSAYGSLVTAGMLSLLYLYRGRSFVVYWIVGWLLTAAALGLAARTYADA